MADVPTIVNNNEIITKGYFEDKYERQIKCIDCHCEWICKETDIRSVLKIKDNTRNIYTDFVSFAYHCNVEDRGSEYEWGLDVYGNYPYQFNVKETHVSFEIYCPMCKHVAFLKDLPPIVDRRLKTKSVYIKIDDNYHVINNLITEFELNTDKYGMANFEITYNVDRKFTSIGIIAPVQLINGKQIRKVKFFKNPYNSESTNNPKFNLFKFTFETKTEFKLSVPDAECSTSEKTASLWTPKLSWSRVIDFLKDIFDD